MQTPSKLFKVVISLGEEAIEAKEGGFVVMIDGKMSTVPNKQFDINVGSDTQEGAFQTAILKAAGYTRGVKAVEVIKELEVPNQEPKEAENENV